VVVVVGGTVEVVLLVLPPDAGMLEVGTGSVVDVVGVPRSVVLVLVLVEVVEVVGAWASARPGAAMSRARTAPARVHQRRATVIWWASTIDPP